MTDAWYMTPSVRQIPSTGQGVFLGQLQVFLFGTGGGASNFEFLAEITAPILGVHQYFYKNVELKLFHVFENFLLS